MTNPENGLFGQRLLEEIRANFKKLYPMPHVMLKAKAIIADPDSDFNQISSILNTDQALASRILKIANSAYFGLDRKVSTIKHAAMLLGTKRLIQVVNMISHSRMLNTRLEGYGLKAGDAWRHSLTVAVGSDIIARKIARDYIGEAFLAGLLHDAGKILLDKYIQQNNRPYYVLTEKLYVSSFEAEVQILGVDHAKIGGELCRHWSMPGFVADAIANHHVPSHSGANLLAYIIHAADVIANALHQNEIEELHQSIDREVIKFLRFKNEELMNTGRLILEGMEELEENTY